MPVGTASTPQPSSIITEAIARPTSVLGTRSPKPTVVMVEIAQYIATGMLVKPCSGPSTTYISVPITSTTSITKPTNTVILRGSPPAPCASARYSAE